MQQAMERIGGESAMERLSAEEKDALLRMYWNGEVTALAVRTLEKLKK